MHDGFMSQDSKKISIVSPLSNNLATLSVYIFQAGLLKMQNQGAVRCMLCKGFDDIDGPLLIHLSPGDPPFQAQR
jgi:hypothetical protein